MAHALYEFKCLPGDADDEWLIRRIPYGKWHGPFGSQEAAIEGLMTIPAEPRESALNEIEQQIDRMTAHGCSVGSGSMQLISLYAQKKLDKPEPLSDREIMTRIAALAVLWLEDHPKEKTDDEE